MQAGKGAGDGQHKGPPSGLDVPVILFGGHRIEGEHRDPGLGQRSPPRQSLTPGRQTADQLALDDARQTVA